MAQDLFQDIIKKIKAYDTIIIHRHQRPDPDAIGSQCGLREMIRASFPGKKVLAAGSSAGSLNFLARMDAVQTSDYQDALVIVTDTANAGRIDGEDYSKGDFIIKIDHHPDNPNGDYADLAWTDSSFSSCSEMIGKLWQEAEESLTMTSAAARLLYAGIVGDTNRFLYGGTTPQTMRIAADLMTYDFDHAQVNDEMNRMSAKELKLQAYALNHLEITDEGTAYLILDQNILDDLGIKDEDTHSVVPLPRQVEGVMNWGIFVQQGDGSYRCRLRSTGPTINQIAQDHDGGGHALACGANAKDREEVQTIIKKLSQVAQAYSNQ